MAKLMSAVSEPNAPGVTVVQPTVQAASNGAATVAEKKGSGKSKAELGIPEDWKVAWPPIAFSPEDHERITKVVRYRNSVKAEGAKNYGIDQLLIEMAHYGIHAHKAQFDEQAAKAPASTAKTTKAPLDFSKLTPEQAQIAVDKELASAQKRYNDAQALLTRMREAAAAGTIGAGIVEEASETEDDTEDDE